MRNHEMDTVSHALFMDMTGAFSNSSAVIACHGDMV
jgi:hypothetical protein